MESHNGLARTTNELNGIDNVAFTAVPEPASAVPAFRPWATPLYGVVVEPAEPFDSAAGLLPRLHELRPDCRKWPRGRRLDGRLLCGAVGLELAWHYPGYRGSVAGVVAAGRGPDVGRGWVQTPLIVLAPLAVCGPAPLTGWITFEEMDLLVTAVVSGGNPVCLWGPASGRLPGAKGWPARQPPQPRSCCLLPVRYTASGAACRTRGGWQFGWFQGLSRAP